MNKNSQILFWFCCTTAFQPKIFGNIRGNFYCDIAISFFINNIKKVKFIFELILSIITTCADLCGVYVAKKMRTENNKSNRIITYQFLTSKLI